MTSTTTTIGTSETVRLYGWDTWEAGKETILARLFGEMVARTTGVVQQFHSDLYHDAAWLQRNLDGEGGFDYLVRHSGTNIGESARIGVQIGAGRGFVLYRVELTCDRPHHGGGMWSATFTVLDADTEEA
jgi:hypothetical protein